MLLLLGVWRRARCLLFHARGFVRTMYAHNVVHTRCGRCDHDWWGVE